MNAKEIDELYKKTLLAKNKDNQKLHDEYSKITNKMGKEEFEDHLKRTRNHPEISLKEFKKLPIAEKMELLEIDSKYRIDNKKVKVGDLAYYLLCFKTDTHEINVKLQPCHII